MCNFSFQYFVLFFDLFDKQVYFFKKTLLDVFVLISDCRLIHF